jgi:uncharacterized membrane protein
MAHFRIIVSIAVLIASVSILFTQLAVTQPIQIILETGQEVVTQDSSYFSLSQVLILIMSSFLIGSTAIYLYFKSETEELLKSLGQKREVNKKYEMVIPILRGDERMVFQKIIDNKGEMLQNALVLKTRLTKVKMTRVLAGLQNKNLIVKERHGLTNKIKLK